MHQAMHITINDNRQIATIRDEFTHSFPYLRLEFFTQPHLAGKGSPRSQLYPVSSTLGQCRTRHNGGSVMITGEMTVADLEQRFLDVYGLSVQVFRKSGKVWLETTVTDGWTLNKQNQQGAALSGTKPVDE